MKTKLIVSIIVALITIFAVVSVYAESETKLENVEAKIVEIKEIKEINRENEPTQKVENVKIRILEGEYENEEYEMSYIITEDIESITSNIELKEESKILVNIEEKEGEIISVSYIETLSQNQILYIVGIILIILLLIISRKRATLIYLVSIILCGCIIILSLQNGWNLLLISSILSILITVILFISINGLNKQTIIMIIRAIVGISISGVLIYLLFDIMKLQSINIKLTEKFINLKELICSATILFSAGIYNSIAISGQYIFYANNKPYKTKSDNIIKGQRSLKL